MKQLAIVRPIMTINAEKTHSKYSYPDYSGLIQTGVTYNRILDDFLTEQLWLVEGTQTDIDVFLASPLVELAGSWDEVDIMTSTWNPDVEHISDPKAVLAAINILKGSVVLPPILNADDSTLGINKKVFSLENHVPKASMI